MSLARRALKPRSGKLIRKRAQIQITLEVLNKL